MRKTRNHDEALREGIRRQRALYAQALDAGYSVADASLIAVGRKEMGSAASAEPFDKNAAGGGEQVVDNLPPGPGAGNGEGEADPRDEVEIPADWKTAWKWNDLRRVASKVSPTPVSNREECEQAIEAELLRRAEKAAG